MNIAFVCIEDANDPHSWSGIPYRILNTMRDLGHKVHVISPLRRKFKYLYAVSKYIWSDLQIDREPVALASYARQISRALRTIDADLVFSTSSIPVAYLECKQPIIWWSDAIYCGMVGYYAAFSSRSQARAYDQERSAIERAANVIYASEWAANIARSQYPQASSKIKVLPFGSNLPAPLVLPGARDPKPPYKLLFLGVDWERKGGPIALGATKILNERGLPTVLRVVGCDPPPADRDSRYIECYGFISKRTAEGIARIQELLNSSDFLFLPTRAEAAGIVFCEASAHGLPIVATGTGGVGTYVRDGVNGMLLPSDAGAEAYAALIEGILRDGSLYSRLSRGARDEYENRLNWTASVEQLLQLPVSTTSVLS